MKKNLFLLAGLFIFYSCLNSDEPTFTYEYLPIDEAETPASFTFGEKDTISIKYSLLNGCYYFDNLYYEYKDSTRIVAVRALLALDKYCTEAIIQEEYKFVVNVTQKEDYIFKFWKGKNNQGENVYEELIVPVN